MRALNHKCYKHFQTLPMEIGTMVELKVEDWVHDKLKRSIVRLS